MKLKDCIIGGPYNSLPVGIQPEITLVRWQVMEVSSKTWGERTLHLVGTNVAEWSGRASTPVHKFDKDQMIATTESGRVYKLEGKPGESLDSRYVWGLFVEVNGIFDEKDVTTQFVSKPQPSHR